MIVYFFISIICVLGLIFSESVEPFKDWATFTTLITFTHACFSTLLMKRVCRQWTSFPLLVLFSLFLFNYGQLWLYGFDRDFQTQMAYNKITIYPKPIYVTTCIIIMSFISSLTIGAFFAINKRKIINKINFGDSYTKFDIKQIGIIILAVTIPFNIYENSLYVIASIMYGYKEIFGLGIPSYVTTLSWMSVIGAVCMIKALPNRKKTLLLFFVTLYGLEMLSGNRGPSVIAILTLFMFYNLFYPVKINIRQTLKYFILLFIGAIVLSSVKTFRGYTDKTIDAYFIVLGKCIEDNALLQDLDEFGGAIAFPSIVQIYLDQTGNYLKGWTYISSFAGILPNVGIIDVGKITQSGSIVRILQNHGIYGPYQSISSSSVSEALMNFGIWGMPIFALLLGLIVGRVYLMIEKYRTDPRVIYFVMACYGILHWARGSFGPLVRHVIWGSIIIWICMKLSRRKLLSRQY